jgi:hypothetical protein
MADPCWYLDDQSDPSVVKEDTDLVIACGEYYSSQIPSSTPSSYNPTAFASESSQPEFFSLCTPSPVEQAHIDYPTFFNAPSTTPGADLSANSQCPPNPYNATAQPQQALNNPPWSSHNASSSGAQGEVNNSSFNNLTSQAFDCQLTHAHCPWFEDQILQNSAMLCIGSDATWRQPSSNPDVNVTQNDPSIEGDVRDGLSESHISSQSGGSSVSLSDTRYGRIPIILGVASLRCYSAAECSQGSTPTHHVVDPRCVESDGYVWTPQAYI